MFRNKCWETDSEPPDIVWYLYSEVDDYIWPDWDIWWSPWSVDEAMDRIICWHTEMSGYADDQDLKYFENFTDNAIPVFDNALDVALEDSGWVNFSNMIEPGEFDGDFLFYPAPAICIFGPDVNIWPEKLILELQKPENEMALLKIQEGLRYEWGKYNAELEEQFYLLSHPEVLVRDEFDRKFDEVSSAVDAVVEEYKENIVYTVGSIAGDVVEDMGLPRDPAKLLSMAANKVISGTAKMLKLNGLVKKMLPKPKNDPPSLPWRGNR